MTPRIRLSGRQRSAVSVRTSVQYACSRSEAERGKMSSVAMGVKIGVDGLSGDRTLIGSWLKGKPEVRTAGRLLT